MNMGMKRWRTGALDRIEWASVMREGKAKTEEEEEVGGGEKVED